MNVADGEVSNAAGLRMIEELRAVHRPLRNDIAVLERALELLSDATADHSQIPDMIGKLTVADFVWQLRVNCDYYCNVLTVHHSLEDQRMFPVLLREFPEIAPVVERLYAEHAAVAGLITEAKSAALRLTADASTVDRAKQAVSALAAHLRAHLDFEEQSLFPYFRKMQTDWHLG